MIGRTLRHYRVKSAVGAGGMGEVYRATDGKLGRDVAIKVLPAEVAQDAERLARFEREAKLLASLNHTNIAHVYGFESAALGEGEAVHFLAMELVEGEDLAERLRRGAIPVDEALEIARQIAAALEEAHEKGIVHRDLKPANIKVAPDGKVKVLDFGLAKAYAGESAVGSGRDLSQSPTLAHTGTQAGVILGTAAYMSPEQARGKPVDKRSDIWAFGVVLWEMLTGKQLFAGETVSDVMAGVLKTEIDVSTLPHGTPPPVQRLLRSCLARNPKDRLHDIADARLFFAEVAAGEPAEREAARTTARPRRGAVATAVALALLGGIALGYLLAAKRPEPGSTTGAGAAAEAFQRLTFQPGAEDDPALSPDGETLYFVMRGPGGDDDIFFVPVGGRKPINLTPDSSADDRGPAISPDGRRIAFRSERDGGGIFLMGTTGESVRRLVDGCFDPAWSPDGKAIACSTCPEADPFSRGCKGALRVVDVDTGKGREIETYDAAAPAWSPDGRRIAYWGLDAGESGRRDLYLVDVAGGDPIELTRDAAVDWNPIWSADGAALEFLSDRGGSPNLWRLPIDAGTGRPAGPPQSVVLPTELAWRARRSGDRLAYVSRTLRSTIVSWSFDPDRLVVRKDSGRSVLATVGQIFTHSLSPDGRSVAYSTVFPRQDLFVVPIDGGAPTQLTDDAAIDRFPSWDPDGRRLLFMSNRGGRYEFWGIGADGSGLEQLTRTTDESAWMPRLSPDRRRLSGVSFLGTSIFDASGPPPWDRFERVEDPAARGGTQFIAVAWSRDGGRLAGRVTASNAGGAVGVAVWSLRERKLRRFDVEGQPLAWLPDDRRLLVQLQGGRSGLGGSLVALDVETGRTTPVDAPELEGWQGLAADSSLRTLVGFRNEAEADIWLAKGGK